MSLTATAARELLVYMLWADRLTIGALRGIRTEDLVREAGVSFGSLLGTLVHTLSAQRRWLARFTGQAELPHLDRADFSDLITWIVAWEEAAADVEAFLASLTDEHLEHTLTWTPGEGGHVSLPLWQAVLHLVNHTTYHRGQVVSLLRQMGYPPPSTDLVDYFRERAGG